VPTDHLLGPVPRRPPSEIFQCGDIPGLQVDPDLSTLGGPAERPLADHDRPAALGAGSWTPDGALCTPPAQGVAALKVDLFCGDKRVSRPGHSLHVASFAWRVLQIVSHAALSRGSWWFTELVHTGRMHLSMGLSPEHRSAAREAAEAQVPDLVILGALRADVYESTEPGPERDAMLAVLEAMAPEDTLELDAFRDRGRTRLQLVMYACALAYRINADKRRFDPANPEHAPEDFTEVDPKAAGMAQFLARTYLALDPSVLREDAAREAQRMASLGSAEQRAEVIGILPMLGLSRETTAAVAREFGLTVLDGGKTA
jgi:hypothetical protein